MIGSRTVASKSTLMIPIKFSAYGVNFYGKMVDKILNACVISGFRSKIEENCALLGYYAAISGKFLRTFRYNLLVSSSGVKNPNISLWIPFYT